MRGIYSFMNLLTGLTGVLSGLWTRFIYVLKPGSGSTESSLGTWHYAPLCVKTADGREEWSMCEVFPDIGHTMEQRLWAESLGDLRWSLAAMLNDIDKYEPVIVEDETETGAMPQ